MQYLKRMLTWIFKKAYAFNVQGLDTIPRSGPRIILANHTSFLDVPILACCLDTPCAFVVNTLIAKRWWIKLILKFSEAYIMDPSAAIQMKTLMGVIKSGTPLIIFPEGGITTTGSLMKLYDGAAVLAHWTQAQISILHIDGPQYTCFSRLKQHMRFRLTHPIRVTIHPPETLEVDPALVGRARRKALGQTIYDRMITSIYTGTPQPETLWDALIHIRAVLKNKTIACEDIRRKPITYTQLLEQACALAQLLTQDRPMKRCGILLPNSTTTISLFFALQRLNITPVMLNPSLGIESLLDGCQLADVDLIITSESLLSRTPFNRLIPALQHSNYPVKMIESYRKKLSKWITLKAALQARASCHYWKNRHSQTREDPAVILMTSGSEARPKAVRLSQKNILSNMQQAASVLPLDYRHHLFNPMPMFHAFGLTLGTLLPLLKGLRLFTYPNPLHSRIIPELIYQIKPDFMLSTHTFLTRMAQVSKPEDWTSIQGIFCGGEPIEPQTFQHYSETFGVRLLQGYGTTETSPLVSLNTPSHNCAGTVGRLLPGINIQLTTVEGLNTGQHLSVSGPNIMTERFDPNQDSQWVKAPKVYETGDIVTLDAQGYLSIVDRLSRFAKIAGERISLHGVEQGCQACFPHAQHAVIAISGGTKSEIIIWFTTDRALTLKDLHTFWRTHARSALSKPTQVYYLDALPHLPTGKINYPQLKQHDLKTLKNI